MAKNNFEVATDDDRRLLAGIVCVHCGSEQTIFTGRYHKKDRYTKTRMIVNRHHCQACGAFFDGHIGRPERDRARILGKI